MSCKVLVKVFLGKLHHVRYGEYSELVRDVIHVLNYYFMSRKVLGNVFLGKLHHVRYGEYFELVRDVIHVLNYYFMRPYATTVGSDY